jgi:hypothetical protein
MLRKVDLMVFLDTVKVNLRSFQRRNRIRTPAGWMWLTVPILKEQGVAPKFRSARINDSIAWREKHWRAICSSYSRAAFFDEHRDFLEAFYGEARTYLLDVNVALIEYLARELGVDTKTRYASELGPRGTKTELLVDVCKKVGATTYLSGPTAKNYLKPNLFEAEGIALKFHEYTHPVYEQRFPGFLPNMSSIDLLFNAGERARRIL